MIIYVDENMPAQLSRGFDMIQQPLNSKLREPIEVRSIKDLFGEGAKDEDWIPKLSGQDACVITQDYNIHRIRSQRQLCHAHGVGMFYFRPPSRTGFSYLEMFQMMARHWPEMTQKATKLNRPFEFKALSQSKRLMNMDD